eukprot:3722148-Prorocentrum_lima.AAC.1
METGMFLTQETQEFEQGIKPNNNMLKVSCMNRMTLTLIIKVVMNVIRIGPQTGKGPTQHKENIGSLQTL